MADALDQVYRQYGPVIYAHCRSILDDSAGAEDATHDTFMRVQRHLASAPNTREALFWIYRIATNVCLNEIRNRKRRPAPVEALPDRGDATALPDLANQDLAQRLFSEAAPKIRDVAWLHFIDGLDQAEVAQALDISRGTVVNRLARFRAAARKLLGRD